MLTDALRWDERAVSDGMRYAPKSSTRFEAQEIKETGKEKNVSTAVARQAKNFRDHKLTIGLDLGDRSNWYLRARRLLPAAFT